MSATLNVDSKPILAQKFFSTFLYWDDLIVIFTWKKFFEILQKVWKFFIVFFQKYERSKNKRKNSTLDYVQ